MRSKCLLLAGSVCLLVLIWTACKKNDHPTVVLVKPPTSVPNAADAKEQADMQMMIYQGLNGVITEGNLVPVSQALKGLAEDSLLSLGATLLGIPPSLTCGATMTASGPTEPVFTYYNYNGNTCHGFSVEGRVGVLVDTSRLQLTLSIDDLVLTRLSDGRKFGLHTAAGTGYLTVSNLSLSHYPLDLGPGSQPFQQNITGTAYADDLSNDVSYTMNLSMIKQYSYSPNGLVMKSWGWKGDDSIGRNVALDGVWSDSHHNTGPFDFRIMDTLVAKQSCGWRMTSGILKEHSATEDQSGSDIYTTFTFGLDKDGLSTGCMGVGDYYFRAFWQGRYGAPDTTSVMIAY